MASLNLQLSRKNPAQLLAQAELSAGELAPAAPATPPLPNMAAKVALMVTAHDEAKAANDDYEATKALLVTRKNTRDAKLDALRLEMKSVASAVESEAKGDATLLAASGFPLAATPAQTSAAPDQVINFTLTGGEDEGALDGQHDPADGAKTYEVALATVDPIAGPWVTVLQPTTSSWSLTGLTSGQRVWVKVRGIGSNGHGPWSDPATKIVP